MLYEHLKRYLIWMDGWIKSRDNDSGETQQELVNDYIYLGGMWYHGTVQVVSSMSGNASAEEFPGQTSLIHSIFLTRIT